MRFSGLLPGVLLLAACVAETAKPPYLDGGVPPPVIPGGGGDGGAKDTGTSDAGVATLASVLNARGLSLSGGYAYVAAQNTGAATGTLLRVATLGAAPEELVTNLAEPWAGGVAHARTRRRRRAAATGAARSTTPSSARPP